MKVTVQITETLQRLVEVEVPSFGDAVEAVRLRYRFGDIVLDSSDHVDTEINMIETQGGCFSCN